MVAQLDFFLGLDLKRKIVMLFKKKYDIIMLADSLKYNDKTQLRKLCEY